MKWTWTDGKVTVEVEIIKGALFVGTSDHGEDEVPFEAIDWLTSTLFLAKQALQEERR